ncbi:MAG TPA: OPT/YSL family transporter [Polyangia bacterium]|nr:OPT/YSL family transporter [Polyangia bacterium]
MTAHDVPAVRRFLPAPGSLRYHLLLAAVALFILGPLGGVTAAYMTFSLGFFVGGQVLAGILGSSVTYGYGADGKHGANYMQTMAASVASMSGMGVLIQAMVWLGIPLPPSWVLALYFACIGMFGIGVGMLYTPILVDRLQLEYPSGHAVANILRALTDKRLLRRSIGKLGGGTGAGIVVAALVEKIEALGNTGLSASTLGAGLIVSSRIAVPALVMGGVLTLLTPSLRAIGWLGPHDPFRKIGFLIALGMIMGAAVLDLGMLAVEAARRFRALPASRAAAPAAEDTGGASGGLGVRRLAVWCLFWAAALVVVATQLLHQPPGFIIFAIALTFVFVFVNGIASGISDSNPISSAFVVSVLLMSLLGLRDPAVGMMAANILLVSCTVGVDMQQDRSTGWRLHSNRTMQFRYQAVGIVMGAVLAVALAQFFLNQYPVLKIDIFTHPEAKVGAWQSAMTFKFVGAIRDLGHLPPYKLLALGIGLGIGFFTQVARRLLARHPRWRAATAPGGRWFAAGWLVDSVLLSSPYASSFGGFVELATSVWFAVGGVLSSAEAMLEHRRRARLLAARAPGSDAEVLPDDMSTTSLVGGGLIAGESLCTLAIGIISLLSLRR